MGLELNILGLRKLKDEEIKELTGKTQEEMRKSKYFRQFFPKAPYDSWYRAYSLGEVLKDKSVMHVLSPVEDADGDTVYVLWIEVLASYWHKNPYDREQIELLLEDVESSVDWDQSFHVVAYEDIRSYMNRKPSVMDTDEEVVAFIYG